MSIEKLKQVRDEVEAQGVGVYLEVVQKLFSGIDEHVNDVPAEVAVKVTKVQQTLQAKAVELQAKVDELEAKLAAYITSEKSTVSKAVAEVTLATE